MCFSIDVSESSSSTIFVPIDGFECAAADRGAVGVVTVKGIFSLARWKGNSDVLN